MKRRESDSTATEYIAIPLSYEYKKCNANDQNFPSSVDELFAADFFKKIILGLVRNFAGLVFLQLILADLYNLQRDAKLVPLKSS